MLYVDIRLGWFRATNRVESIDCPSAFFLLVSFFTKLLKWFSLFADGLSRIKLIFIIHLVEPEQQMQTETNSDQPRPLLRLGHLHNCHKPGKINCIYQTTIVVQLHKLGRGVELVKLQLSPYCRATPRRQVARSNCFLKFLPSLFHECTSIFLFCTSAINFGIYGAYHSLDMFYMHFLQAFSRQNKPKQRNFTARHPLNRPQDPFLWYLSQTYKVNFKWLEIKSTNIWSMKFSFPYRRHSSLDSILLGKPFCLL